MIPIRLELRNFLPYRAPDPLRFEGIHLACLTGPNGAGKSSLLDAITWALWGRARAKRDDEMVHLGQKDMYVQLDFEQEGVLWRVLRRRSAGKRGSSTLDLFILHENGERVLQSENAIRLTQDKINRILRLDYETFIHSAFLQQGKADAFTTRTPAQRKQILSDILGLAQWEKYEDAVKEHLKGITAQLIYIEGRIKEIDIELARKPGLEKQLTDATAAHEEAQKAREAAEARLKEVEHAPTELRNANSNKGDRERRKQDMTREIGEVDAQIARQREQIAGYQEVIAAQVEIEEGYAALQSAREQNQEFSDKLRQLRTLDEQHADLQSQLSSAKARLENEADNLRRTINELETSLENDFGAELESTQAEIHALQDIEIQRETLREQENAGREDLSRFATLRETLTAEGQALRERLEKLEATDEAVCPLCGQDLTPEHREQLVVQLNEEIEFKREIYRQNETQITDMQATIKALKAEIKGFDDDLKGKSALDARIGALQTQVEASGQAETRLTDEMRRLEAIEKQLAEDDFAADVREQLAALEATQDELGYDQSTHDEMRQQIDSNMRYEQMQVQLKIALESLPALEEAVQGGVARKTRLNEHIADIDKEIAELDSEINRLAVLVQEYNAREEEARTLRTREQNAYGRMVTAQQELDALASQATRKVELEQKREQARYDEALYDQLRRAFGKNGIPAMIIETAIPELESEANELLARMTDGRMHLTMNTQREKITGGVQETLDIEIADELGTRSYEMYSGGEAFRINFAIRVALSKMLARRAGAHLRTLFIDEGFGTQDEAGRNKLVEAITAIQEDFDLILVITHIDELRDNFPVHIVVDKTGAGSTVSLR